MLRNKLPNDSVNAGELIRSKARTFYLASLFLPRHVRRDVHLVYAYYRTIDDLVDEPPTGWTHADILGSLEEWNEVLLGYRAPTTPLMKGIVRLMQTRGISTGHLTMVLDGARFDLEMRAIETREDLLRYAVLVAGSVGMVMAPILGAGDEAALSSACDLGVAMQLTNVLRDVGEDLQRGRMYLPRAELSRAGVSSTDLHSGTVTPPIRQVMDGIIDDARRFYQHGTRGIQHLDPSVRFSIYLAATLYARILDKIERHDYDVFTRRAHLGMMEKWILALPAYVEHRRLIWNR